MSSDYVVKAIPPVQLAGITATFAHEEFSQHIEPMFDSVRRALTEAGASLATPIATYDDTATGMEIVVGYACSDTPPPGIEAIELPAAANAVCGVHLGPMAKITESWQQLHQWTSDNGYLFAGPCRELYIKAESDDQSDWMTELQQPVTMG